MVADDRNGPPLDSVPNLVVHEVITKINDVKTFLNLAATNTYFQHWCCWSRRDSPLLVDNASLVVSSKNGDLRGVVVTPNKPLTVSTTFFSLSVYAECLRFRNIRIRTNAIRSKENCYKLKNLSGFCLELCIEMDDCQGNENISTLVEVIKPKMTKVFISKFTLHSPDLLFSFDDCRNIDITISDIQRVTDDLLFFAWPHETVILRVQLFAVDLVRRMFRRWDENQIYNPFGSLKRLEILITNPTFIYSPNRMLKRRNVRFLGASTMNDGAAVILGNERKALVIFDLYRIVFIPLSFPGEELCILVEEYCQKLPVDLSSLLSIDNPLNTLLQLQKSSSDDWD